MAVDPRTALPYPPPGGVQLDSGASPAASTLFTLTAQQLANETGADLLRAERVLGVVYQAINEYAPLAPSVLKDEAGIRFGGYLLGSDYGGVSEESIGPQSVKYPVNHAAMFRNSGAAALLTQYKRRRAGAI